MKSGPVEVCRTREDMRLRGVGLLLEIVLHIMHIREPFASWSADHGY